jgi:uncharacterized protein (DUF488 family)
MNTEKNTRIFTIGHSTRPIKEFLEILKHYKVKLVVDVRKIPKSRHNPQYETSRLQKSLAKCKINYLLLPGLAGRRRPKKDSKNLAWRNSSFRGYADHMLTPEFEKALTRLLNLSKRKKLVIMCAEAVPWRCHRSLIADALLAKKVPVKDIFTEATVKLHKAPSFAKIRAGKVTYPLLE